MFLKTRRKKKSTHLIPTNQPLPLKHHNKCSSLFHPLLSLRTLLGVSALGLIFFLGFGIVFTSYFTNLQGLRDVTSQYQRILNVRLQSHLRKYMEQHVRILWSVSSVVAYDSDLDTFMDHEPDARKGEFLYGFGNNQENFQSNGGIMMGSENLDFTMVLNVTRYFSVNSSRSSTSLRIGNYSAAEGSVQFIDTIEDFNVTTRPWYVACKEKVHNIYSGKVNNATSPPIRNNRSPSEMFIFSTYRSKDVVVHEPFTISVPHFDDSNHFRGVIAYELYRPTISTYLSELSKIAETPLHFLILERSGNIFAITDGDYIMDPETGRRVHVTEHSDPQITDLGQQLAERYGTSYKKLSSENSYETFSCCGSRLVSVSFFALGDLELIVTMSVPSSSIYAIVNRMLALGISIVLVLMFTSSVLALVCGFAITRYLFQITNAMKKAKKLKIENIKLRHKKPVLYEYYTIWRSFESLLRRLEDYKAFLPDYVIPISRGGSSEENTPYIEMTPVEEFPVIEIETDSDDRGSQASLGNAGYSPSPLSDAAGAIFDNCLDRTSSRTRFATGLTSSRIGLAYFKIHNMEKLMQNASQYVLQYGKLMDEIASAALSHDGFVRTMHSDSVSIIFSQDKASICLSKMLDAAFLIADKVKELNLTLNTSNPHIDFGISLSHGMLHHGIVGSERNKIFSIFGAAKEDCWLSCCSTERLRVNIVCDIEVFRFIESLNRSTDDKNIVCAPIDIIRGSTKRVLTIFEVKEKIILRDAEWLYEMAFQSARKCNNKMKGAFELFMKDNVEQAASLYAEVLDLRPEDSSIKRLHELCAEWSHKKDSGFTLSQWVSRHAQDVVRSATESLMQNEAFTPGQGAVQTSTKVDTVQLHDV